MKIDFFVVGAQKAGTTAMHAMLREHPQICMAEPKELHLFDGCEMREPAQLQRTLERSFAARSAQHCLLGEATPAYCFVPAAAERIHAHNPDARILMLLRHPAHRAFSQWRMERARGREMLSFDDAIGSEHYARTRVGGAAPNHSYIERGYFAPQVARLLARFGPGRCLFLRTDAFWNDAQATCDRITTFLQLAPVAVASQGRMLRPVQVDRALALDPAQRARLNARYRDDVVHTGELTGLSLADWLADDYTEPMQG